MGTIENIPQGRPIGKPVDDGREAARAKAGRIAQELRRAAREARMRRSSTVLHKEKLGTLVSAVSVPEVASLVRTSFLLAVVLPTVLALLYFGLVASRQYETEARFAVRTGAISGVDAFTSFAGIPSINQVQDSLIVANFVTSRAAVEAIEERIGLRERFADTEIDPISRLGDDATIEDLVDYWKEMVSVSIESPSGIITVEARAFTPRDAREIAEALIAESEDLVNTLGARARQDLIASSRQELDRAEDRVRMAAQDLSQLRAAEGMIDPKLTVEGLNMLVNELRAEAVGIEQQIATTRRTIAADAPQIGLLQARLEAVREQMAALQARLTSEGTGDTDSVAAVMTRFDRLALERQIAERQYAMAAAALEQARASAERQQMYLATFVHPILPEDPVKPRPLLYALIALLLCTALWATGLAAAAKIRERMA